MGNEIRQKIDMRNKILILVYLWLITCVVACAKKNTEAVFVQNVDSVQQMSSDVDRIGDAALSEDCEKKDTEAIFVQNVDSVQQMSSDVDQIGDAALSEDCEKDDDIARKAWRNTQKFIADALAKSNRLEIKNVGSNWDSVNSNSQLPVLKIGASKDAVTALSDATKLNCYDLEQKTVPNGELVQLLACAKNKSTNSRFDFTSFWYENESKLSYEYYEASFKYNTFEQDYNSNRNMCDNEIESELNNLKARLDTVNSAEIVKLYIRIVSPSDGVSRIYEIPYKYELFGDYRQYSGEESYLSVSLYDIESMPWLDTTAYRIRLMTRLETICSHTCSSDLGCETENDSYEINDYIFAGPKYRPVVEWTELSVFITEDPLSCRAVRMNGEVKCDEDSDDENCHIATDENNMIIWENPDQCPEITLSAECQKASFDGSNWVISKVNCQ